MICKDCGEYVFALIVQKNIGKKASKGWCAMNELINALEFIDYQIRICEDDVSHYQSVEKDIISERLAKYKLDDFKNVKKLLEKYQKMLKETHKNDYEILG